MKHTKRLLALFLALFTLAFSLALPASAQESITQHSQATQNPAMPVITVQPQNVRVSLGQVIFLTVEAHIPNGDPIGFRWFRIFGNTAFAMEETTAQVPIFIVYVGTGYFFVEVYNRSNPAYTVRSNTITVEAYSTASSRLPAWLQFILRWFLFGWLWM